MYSSIAIAVILVLVPTIQGKCDKGCDAPVQHYEEIGCIAEYKNPTDCCPEYYNCAEVMGRANDKCFFKDNVYENGDEIPIELTGSNCLASCRCRKDPWNDFTCAHIDCPEFFGHSKLEPGCYRVYESNNCCSTKIVCPPFENVAKCEVNGKTYHEGQRFESGDDKCLNCICKAGFTGKFEAPFCTPVTCGIELLNMVKVKQNCAPVYYGTSRCCPIQWQCYDETDKFETVAAPSVKKCKYGDHELNVGDKIVLEKKYAGNPDISCECVLPPMATCTQKPHDV